MGDIFGFNTLIFRRNIISQDTNGQGMFGEGVLHKFTANFFKKQSWNFYTIRNVGMENDYMLSFSF